MLEQTGIIEIAPINGIINIHVDVDAIYRKEKSGLFTCLIPTLDLAFTVAKEEDILISAKAMLDEFLAIYTSDSLKENGTPKQGTGLNKFIIEIQKLGFKTPKNEYVVMQLLNKHKVEKTSFKKIPIEQPGYEKSAKINFNYAASA